MFDYYQWYHRMTQKFWPEIMAFYVQIWCKIGYLTDISTWTSTMSDISDSDFDDNYYW